MQFIEKNSYDVRSAVYRLKKEGGAVEFVLFPMVHVGSKEFYSEVSRRLAACDLILAEGVDSKRARLLTLSYRVVRWIKRMDLVTQREGMDVSGLRARIVNSDMDGRAFDAGWSSLPLRFRAQVFLFVPLYAAHLFLFGTRETLAEKLALEDLPSSEEILLQDEDLARLDDLLLDRRDRLLIERVRQLMADARGEQLVGIVYGAAHMRNVVSFLLRSGYRVASAEWVTVFEL